MNKMIQNLLHFCKFHIVISSNDRSTNKLQKNNKKLNEIKELTYEYSLVETKQYLFTKIFVPKMNPERKEFSFKEEKDYKAFLY